MSDFYKVVEGNSNNVVVVFCSVDVPPGKFNATNTLNDIAATVIYLNCEDNSWYLKGVPGLGSCLISAAKALNELVCTYKGQEGRVLYYGGSMGGYGAFAYGSLNHADFILATGIQLNFHNDLGYFNRFSRVSLSDLEVPDLIDFFESSTSKACLLFGENALDDFFEVEALAKNNRVELFSVPNSGHSVPVMINKVLGISSVINEVLRTGEFCLLEALRGDLSKNYQLLYYFKEAEAGVGDIFFANKLERLGAESKSESIKSYCYYYSALVYYSLNDFRKAEQLLRLSVFWNGNYIKPLMMLAKLYETRNNSYEFSLCYEKVLSINKYYPSESENFLYLLYAEGCKRLAIKDKLEEIVAILSPRIVNPLLPISKRFENLIKDFSV